MVDKTMYHDSFKEHAFAYVRVSTKEQNLARQFAAIEGLGVLPEHVYVDRQSGKDFARPSYQKLLRKLKSGDTLYVKSIDRLGRNYTEILEQWRILTKEKGVLMVVLDMSLLDTRKNDENNLTGVFIADMVLQILSYVAETERSAILERQKEGIREAKARGVQFGRRRISLPEEQVEDLCRRYAAGKITREKAGEELGVSYKTFLRRYREYCDAGSGMV